MQKTAEFREVMRLRQSYVLDAKSYGFVVHVVDSSLVGEPEEASSSSKHKIKVGIAYELLVNWRLLDVDEDALVKVLFHYARRHVERRIKEGGLFDYEELPLMTPEEHPEGNCPLDIARIPDPIGFRLKIEVDDQQPQATTRSAIILTALPVECNAVVDHLSNIRQEVHKEGTVYECGRFSSAGQIWDVGVAEVGAGNSSAAVEAERAVGYFSPEVMLFVGVAGGVKPKDVGLGDVVAASKVYGYEAGQAGEEFGPRPEVGNPAYGLVQRAKAVARNNAWASRIKGTPSHMPKAIVGPIAAGEKLVKSTKSEVYSFIGSQYSDALAVEMEGSGFLKAAYANAEVAALVVRGISDLVENKDEADEADWQKVAAQHASAFAFEVLAQYAIPLTKPRQQRVPTLSVLQQRLLTQLDSLPNIRPLHLNHTNAISWRRTAQRHLRDLDQASPGNKWEAGFNDIGWHPPNGPDEDARKQRDVFVNACNGAEALLQDALLMLQEEINQIRR